MTRRNSFVNTMIEVISILLLTVSAAHGETAFSELVKLYPASLAVDASPAFTQKAKDDRESAWRLFDRDTGTAYAPGKTVSVKLTLPSAQDIRLVRIYGQGSYIVNIYRPDGADWKRVASLSGIDAGALSPAWNSLEPGQPLREKFLLLEFIPTGNRRIGIGEMELWGTGTGGPATATLAGMKGAADAENILAKNPPHILSIPGDPSEISLSPDAGLSGDASLQLDQAPSLFKRAYLLFDGYGIPRSAFLRKGINGTVWTGGASIPVSDSEKTAWSSNLEEINPAWLSLGNNRIYMDPSIPSAVRGLKLLAETDSGWNDIAGVVPAELYDGDTSTFAQLASVGDGVTLEFERKVQPLSLLLHLPYSHGGKATIQFRAGGNWDNAGSDIEFSALSPGWNEIRLPSCRAADALRLTVAGLPEGDGPIVLDEARVAASPVGSPSEQASLVVTYPRDGEYFGRTAFIQGFARAQADLLGRLSVSAEGKSADTDNTSGTFGLTLLKDETGFAAQTDDDPWSLELKADLAGVALNATVPLTRNSAPSSDTDGSTGGDSTEGKSVKEKVVPGQAKKIQMGKVGLDIPKDGVSKETDISITALSAEELAAMDTGLTNVTSPDSGYRFLPHGSRFKNKITVTIPYDSALLPPGLTEQDITTYYFDEGAGAWKPLEKVRVDTGQKVVVSLTDHFTDMINATLTVPDHPQTVSFNPTSIKDIKAADPGAEVNLIEPPKPNNMGDARLSYPIEVPPGRNGLAPQIAVQYNSSGGNGWMGVGWDIPMQSITIDTRWGVPRYDTGLETETYMLDGEQLTPLAHRGELQPRTAEKVFHTRVEGQFRRIVRHGDRPNNYWWEVTDKNGTRYAYGGDLHGSRVDGEAVLADPAGGNIFRWALREVRDTNGNTMRYSFARAADGGTAEGSQFYLKEIRYTGRPGKPGPYSVTFVRDRELGETRRPDAGVDARAGFRVVTADILRKIEVRLNGEMIRSYDFAYREGAFKKTLLKAVSQYGEKGELFNIHEFDYYDDIRNADGAYKGFDPSHKPWDTGSDGVSAGLLGFGDASALAGSEGDSLGGHLYVGFSPAGYNKNYSFGFKIGYTTNDNDGVLQLIDIDGDGLPDKVFRKGDTFYFRRNLSGPSGETKYDDNARTIATLPAISGENSDTTTFGAEAYAYGVNTLADYSTTFSEATTYFSDVNGDGLPDLVSDGKVYFNHLENGVPAFTTNSADTPAPVGVGKVDTEGLIRDYSAIYEKRIDTFPLMDAVRRWTAPYDGNVTVTGNVSLVEDASDKRKKYKTADGVRVAIQQNGSELWHDVIAADDYSAHGPGGLRGIPVKQGDSIYFRVQSRFDGKYDQVSWDPEIVYENTGPAGTDVNNLDPYRYKASGDFTLAGRTGETQAPLDGTVQITGAFEKNGVTSDDVAVEVYLNGNLIFSRSMAWDSTGVINLNEQTHVNKYDMLKFRVRTDSPIDVGKLRWTPVVTYTSADGGIPVRDRNGNSMVTVNAPYAVDLYPQYQPSAPPSPQEPWVAAQSGTVTVTPSVSLAGAASSDVVFTVKKRGVLVAKQVISAANGGGAGSPLRVSVQKGDEVFFDFNCRDADVKGSAAVTVDSVSAPCAFHTAGTAGAFPVPYRGWSVTAYNGNRERADHAIDESLLGIDRDYKMENARVYPLVPFPADENWRGADDLCWISADRMSSSRLGPDYISVPKPENYAGANAVGRLSSSEQTGVSLGAGYGGVNGSASYSSGSSLGELDFIDMNGDRFPDVAGNGRIQYTAMTGELEPKNRFMGLGSVRKTANDTYNFGIGGSVAFSKPEKGAENEEHGMLMPPLGLSAGYGNGSSDTDYDLVDMNGDGLPDRVSWDHGNLTVSLDVGYGFAPAAVWGGGNISSSGSMSIDVGGNMGYNDGIYGFGGGASLTRHSSGTTKTLLDMNGDGLPDLVVRGDGTMRVAFNKGTGFADFVTWPGGLDKDLAENVGMNLGAGFYFSIAIPIPYCTCSIIINPGFNATNSMSREESAIRDIDGDGYPDFLSSDKDDSITAAANLTGRTNLLKSVKRPLGATMEFEYVRSGNTYDQPQSRWVLSRTTVFDGFSGDGVDKLVTTFAYEGGRYDRLERDFYGYRTITEEQRDAGNNESVYRRTVQTYKTDSYYTKGLLEREIMKDGSDRPYTGTDNAYRLADAFDSFGTVDPQSTTATIFPQLIRTEQYFYEGKPVPGKFTYTEFGYDGYGNVSRFFDAGDAGAQDDVEADIAYTNYAGPYIVGKPSRMIVTSNQKELRRREGTYDPSTGNLLQVRQYLESGRAATTDLSYFGNGTLRSVSGPPNLKGERYSLAYEYDPVVGSFVTGIADSFGYRSLATYKYKYGKVETTVDTNNNQTIMVYDNFGRTSKVFGPYEAGTGIPDIIFEYHPEAAVPWALTRHYDPYRSPADTIDTALFTDGLKRVIQTKKDATIHTGPIPRPRTA